VALVIYKERLIPVYTGRGSASYNGDVIPQAEAST